MRHTETCPIYDKGTKSLRAVQLLLGHRGSGARCASGASKSMMPVKWTARPRS